MRQTKSENLRDRAARLVSGALEGVLLAVVAFSPWAFGGSDSQPLSEFAVFCAIATLLVFWALLILVRWRFHWNHCPVTVLLAFLFFLGVWQITPLPRSLLQKISPATADLYAKLLPTTPEILPAGDPRLTASPPAGSTLSLNPEATRHELLRYLAVGVVFVIVRHNFGTLSSIRRLSWLLVANGAVLALFALIQAFMVPDRSTLYWTVPAEGNSVFGPFVNRSHCASYLNMCIGAGLALLASWSVRDQRLSPHRDSLSQPAFRVSELLHDPYALWISVATALMIVSVPLSLSRGGTSSMLCGFVLLLILTGRHFPRFSRVATVLAVLPLVLGLLTWIGWDQIVNSRLNTLWSGEWLSEMRDGRLTFWKCCWNVVESFPIWGTGYGTLRYVEPMQVHTQDRVGLLMVHAHNEYMEALAEGGILRLAISGLVIGLVFRFGWKALSRNPDRTVRCFSLGFLFSFATIVLHSFVEFGIHLSAIALLATVVAAQLVNLGSKDGRIADKTESNQDAELTAWLPGFVVPASAVIVVLLAFVLGRESWRYAMTESLDRQAYSLADTEGATSMPQQINRLKSAVRLSPRDARIRFALAETQLRLHSELAANIQPPADDGSLRELKEQLQVSGLQHLLLARDLCPVMAGPQIRIAANLDEFENSDPKHSYLKRAKMLAPADPRLWYLCGVEELADGKQQQAWESWRRALQLSPEYVSLVLNQSANHLKPEEMLQWVLPARADVLLLAVQQLFPEEESVAQRQPFLEKSLAALQRESPAMSTEDWYVKAQVHKLLAQPQSAIEAYRAAIAREPRQLGWRYELAELLYHEGNPQQARRELETILLQHPNYPPAKRLLDNLQPPGS